MDVRAGFRDGFAASRGAFRDRRAVLCEGHRVVTKPASATSSQVATEAALDVELRRAEDDFASGEFIDLSVDELDRCIDAGVSPWQRASSG